MIGSLSGVLAEFEGEPDGDATIVVDVGGVGYRVIVGSRQGATLGPIGIEVKLAVHTHVREGAITLYGFSDASERSTFEVLLGAHGVGPSLALGIISAFGPAALANAIADGDVDASMVVPGVGRKTAQRLIVDLAQRFATSLAKAPVLTTVGREGQPDVRSDARAALVALGYAPTEIRHALDRVENADTVAEIVRSALRELAPQR